MSKTVFNASKAPADGGKQFLRVGEIVEHFPGLKTFVFEADGVRTKRVAPQRAGNYIALTAKVGESRVTRAYTLASSPKEAESGVYISTVKKAGILTVDALRAVENPNKLHQQLCGINKKEKLGLAGLKPEDVKGWMND